MPPSQATNIFTIDYKLQKVNSEIYNLSCSIVMFIYSVRTFQRALKFEDRSRPHVRPVNVRGSSCETGGSHAVPCRQTGGQAGSFITLIEIFATVCEDV